MILSWHIQAVFNTILEHNIMNHSTPNVPQNATPLNKEEVRSALLLILKYFTDFCDRNNLYYFLAGGTLLGAIRHKGFIPWDDDIDVFMPRPDYDRMHELMSGYDSDESNYRLIGLQAGAGTWPFAKIIDLNTFVDAEYVANDQQHLWIDIFPVDGLPDDAGSSDRHIQKAGTLKRLYGIATARLGHGKTLSRSLLKIPLNICLRLFGVERLACRMVQHAQEYSYSASHYVGNVIWCVGNGERVRKEVFSSRVPVTFANRTFFGPAGWDEYLHSVYGDYMQLPPVEKQKSNHDIKAYRIPS